MARRADKEPVFRVSIWYASGAQAAWETAHTTVRARTIWSAAKKGMAKVQPVGHDATIVKVEVTLAKLEDSAWWKSR